MTKTERKQRVVNLLDRIRKIQNGTKNIGWGIAEYSPIMDLAENERTDSQYVIVVGHNIYRKIYTMFLEEFVDRKCSLSVIKYNHTGDYIVDKVNEDDLIKSLCQTLKSWFPEIVRGGLENAS